MAKRVSLGLELVPPVLLAQIGPRWRPFSELNAESAAGPIGERQRADEWQREKNGGLEMSTDRSLPIVAPAASDGEFRHDYLSPRCQVIMTAGMVRAPTPEPSVSQEKHVSGHGC